MNGLRDIVAMVNGKVNDFVWGLPMLVLLVGVSLATQKDRVKLGYFQVFFCEDYDERYAKVDTLCLPGLQPSISPRQTSGKMAADTTCQSPWESLPHQVNATFRI